MYGLEALFGAVFVSIGDVIFGTNVGARTDGDQAEHARAAAPTKCLSCGAEKDEHGHLPCGH